MSRNRNQNVLLVEIMIAVLFFALCSTVLLETFVAAREFSRRSGVESRALTEVQDLSEQLYASDDCEQLLTGQGFEQTEAGWQADRGDYQLSLTFSVEDTAAGSIRSISIRALDDGEVLVELPCARYMPGGIS